MKHQKAKFCSLICDSLEVLNANKFDGRWFSFQMFSLTVESSNVLFNLNNSPKVREIQLNSETKQRKEENIDTGETDQ